MASFPIWRLDVQITQWLAHFPDLIIGSQTFCWVSNTAQDTKMQDYLQGESIVYEWMYLGQFIFTNKFWFRFIDNKHGDKSYSTVNSTGQNKATFESKVLGIHDFIHISHIHLSLCLSIGYTCHVNIKLCTIMAADYIHVSVFAYILYDILFVLD